MKNKKLFAILTLVCFMMTLMPVAAFADVNESYVLSVSFTPEDATKTVSLVYVKDGKVVKVFDKVKVDASGEAVFDDQEVLYELGEHESTPDFTVTTPSASDFETTTSGAVEANFATVSLVNFAGATPLATGYYALLGDFRVGDAVDNTVTRDGVDPVAPNLIFPDETADVSYDTSIFVATDGSDSYYTGEKVSYTVKLRDVSGNDLLHAEKAAITIWAEEVSNPGITTSALQVVQGNNADVAIKKTVTVIANGYDLGSVGYNDTVTLTFARPGEYKVYATETANLELAATYKPSTTVDGVITLRNVGDVISVSGTGTTIPQDHYTAKVTVDPAANFTAKADVNTGLLDVHEGQSLGTISTVVANNINDIKVTVEFNNNGKDLTGKTIAISTNSANLNVSKTKATTNALGVISFALSAAREGQYEVYLTVDGCTWTIDVACGNTAAAYIEVVEAPQTLVPLYGTVNTTTPTDGDLNIQVRITDINGNVVGGSNNNGVTNATTVGDAKYVTFTKQPAASKLTNKDLFITPQYDRARNFSGNYILSLNGNILDAEGAYEVKIVLDNGNFVTVPFTVKEFQTPVRLILAYPQNTIELGGTLGYGKLAWMDANGVMKAARGIDLAATGHAIANFAAGTVTVKSDEKYVGSTITVTAVDERYDLVANATLTVADEAAGLTFSTETAEVNVNNKITVQVVDSQGKPVALGNNVYGTTDISYVVLDKPADAKVAIYTADSSKLTAQGKFVMALTSDKVGNVKVQAVVKLTTRAAGVGQAGSQDANVNQVKYYTGVQEFAVGTGEIGKSVVMSIGSNELIVGAKVEKMDAKPMIQNNRTYVPFRALAEAFGATVAYDQATSSVTAELNGVKVVMTVGSPVYTVNGVEKTADVAPFVSDSRTFVPVRFAAEAFGIEVVPTYNTDGSVADVLFNM